MRDIGYTASIYGRQSRHVNHTVAHSLLFTPSGILLLHPHREKHLFQLLPTMSWRVCLMISLWSTTSQSGKTMKPPDTDSLMCAPLLTFPSTWTLVGCNNRRESVSTVLRI
jgi:hypothetical protein